MAYTPKTGSACGCKRGIQRDNCSNCEGTGQVIDFAAIHARRKEMMNFETPTEKFLVRRRDVSTTTDQVTLSTLTLDEVVARLVPTYFSTRELIETTLRSDRLINVRSAQFYAINGQYDR